MPAMGGHDLQRVNHRNAVMNGGESCGHGVPFPAAQQRRFGARCATHQSDIVGADTACGPDFNLNRKRLPDVKAGSGRGLVHLQIDERQHV